MRADSTSSVSTAGALGAMSNPSRASASGKTSRARSGDQKIGSQPSADLEGELDRLRRDRGEVDRDLRPERLQHQLQRLAEPGAADDRDVVVRSVMLEPLAAKRGAHDLDVLAELPERLPPLLAVPALDDLRPRRPEPEQEAPAREQVERRRRHRRVRG